jgi:anaerobic magnesium-protoporphyrin IX monomethyl ester cyclase
MSDILLGQSYFLRFDPKLWQAMQPYPPLGTLYAASYLRQRGYEVGLFDAMLAESEIAWGEALDRAKPRLAVLYEDNFNYLSKMCLLRMRQAAFRMIEMARQRGCTVIVGGADATDHPDLYLAQGANFILIGEGEQTLGELTDALSGRSLMDIPDISGLAWLRDGQVMRSPRRPDLTNLDDLPFPAWDLVDISRYREIWRQRHGYFAVNLATTRGCPFHCNWCAKPIWGQRYHSRSPENVVAEIKWLKECYQPDFLWIVDDIFGLKPGWVQRFADLLDEEGIALPFKCLSRVDLLLRPGEVQALKRAGAQVVWVGAESGSQAILDAMEKGTRVDQIYQATAMLREQGIQVGFFLQFGYPGETLQDIEMTLKMVRECQPDDIGISVAYPLPGTKFYEAVRSQLGVQQNWYDSEDLAMLYQGPYPTAFYRQLHTTVHCEFRARKAWQTLRFSRAKDGELWQALRRGLYYSFRLPFERFKLYWLSRTLHRGVKPITPSLTQPEAARPTPQRD